MSIDPPADSEGDALVGWLATRDVPCPLCGYDLRGLSSPRCPECGQGLRLGISLAEPFLKAWVALLVAVLLPAGFGIIELVGVGYAVVTGHAREMVGNLDWSALAPLLVFLHLAACVPTAVAAIVFRRRFLRWRRSAQIVVAAVACAALLASVSYVLGHTIL